MSGKPAASARVVARLPRTSLGYDLLVVLGSPLGVLTATGEEDQMPPEVPSSPDCQAPSNDLLFSSKFASCIYLSILFFGILLFPGTENDSKSGPASPTYSKVVGARCGLYRTQFLQIKFQFAEFFKMIIYKICALVHCSKLKFGNLQGFDNFL